MIDLITGHQGIPHISAEQISTLHRSLMGSNGDNKVVRMKAGGVTSVGLTVSIDTGYWRVHGYDMQIQEAEAVIFDPTEAGYQRIDDLFVEILQDISSGVQRSELVIVQGEPSTTTPIAPAAPTEAASEYDLLVECVPVCSVLVIEGAMTMTDLTIPFKASSGDSESLAPEFDPERPEPYEIGEIVENEGKLYIFIRQHSGPWDDADVEETTVAALLAGKADNPVPISQGGTGATSAAQARTNLGAASQSDLENTMDLIRGDNDEYSPLTSYTVGRYVVVKPPLVAKETIYKCISPCSPGSWAINQSYFEAKTLTEAVTDLNNDLSNKPFFPDMTNQIIASGGWLTSFTYTATQDCWVVAIGDTKQTGNSVQLKLNGVVVFSVLSTDTAHVVQSSAFIPLKKGDVISKSAAGNGVILYTIYGVRN